MTQNTEAEGQKSARAHRACPNKNSAAFPLEENRLNGSSSAPSLCSFPMRQVCPQVRMAQHGEHQWAAGCSCHGFLAACSCVGKSTDLVMQQMDPSLGTGSVFNSSTQQFYTQLKDCTKTHQWRAGKTGHGCSDTGGCSDPLTAFLLPIPSIKKKTNWSQPILQTMLVLLCTQRETLKSLLQEQISAAEL